MENIVVTVGQGGASSTFHTYPGWPEVRKPLSIWGWPGIERGNIDAGCSCVNQLLWWSGDSADRAGRPGLVSEPLRSCSSTRHWVTSINACLLRRQNLNQVVRERTQTKHVRSLEPDRSRKSVVQGVVVNLPTAARVPRQS